MVRSILRNIAKNRLKDLGYGDVNQKIGLRFGGKETMPGREAINKLQKTQQGRWRLERSLKEHPPMWKEIISGSKKKEADNAVARAGTIRKLLRHPDNPNWPKPKDNTRAHGKPLPVN